MTLSQGAVLSSGLEEAGAGGSGGGTACHLLPVHVCNQHEEIQLQSVLRPGLWAELPLNASGSFF